MTKLLSKYDDHINSIWFLNMTIYITSHTNLTKTAPHKTPLLRKDTIIGLSKSPTNGVLRLKIGGLNPKKSSKLQSYKNRLKRLFAIAYP